MGSSGAFSPLGRGPSAAMKGRHCDLGVCGVMFLSLRGSREASAQAEALEAKVLMCLRRLTGPRGSDPTVL